MRQESVGQASRPLMDGAAARQCIGCTAHADRRTVGAWTHATVTVPLCSTTRLPKEIWTRPVKSVSKIVSGVSVRVYAAEVPEHITPPPPQGGMLHIQRPEATH